MTLLWIILAVIGYAGIWPLWEWVRDGSSSTLDRSRHESPSVRSSPVSSVGESTPNRVSGALPFPRVSRAPVVPGRATGDLFRPRLEEA